ncbi:helix-turn-helix transcriptional regulator [Tolypothrix sp. FACHB-123]|nr:helix-turn-helix transcriptional regulator [Tolypothrix sp. FACHB-123]
MRAFKPRLKIMILRKKAGLTQRQLAEKLGVTVDTIANWERGRVNLWHIEIFVKICDLFNCSHKELLEIEEYDLLTMSKEPELKPYSNLEEMRNNLGTSSHIKSSVQDTQGAEE